MPGSSIHAASSMGPRPGRTIDAFVLITMLACLYAMVVFPIIISSCSPTDNACLLEPRIESKIVWPALSALAFVLAARNFSRLSFPPHIIWLFAYLALAGASVAWAFKPESSFIRFVQQAMIISSIVLPAMLAGRKADLVRGLFICVAIASVLNLAFIFVKPPIDIKNATWGYPGYFAGKNYLGEFATAAALLSIHEILYSGRRRVGGIIILLVAVPLLILSNSKTSAALAIITPLLAGGALLARRMTKLSLAVILVSIPLAYIVFSTVTGVSVNRLSYAIYGDSTFTGRTIIWDFVDLEIAKQPLFGWGYQSFWLVGPDAPSVLDAPGWVKDMPNAHNGYLDVKVELGYVGYAVFMAFILATIHAIGRVADRDRIRAWLILSLVLHIIITNCFESLWMRGFELLWVMFVILAADIARYWKASAPVRAARGSRTTRPVRPPAEYLRPSPNARLQRAQAAKLARETFSPTFPAPGVPGNPRGTGN